MECVKCTLWLPLYCLSVKPNEVDEWKSWVLCTLLGLHARSSAVSLCWAVCERIHWWHGVGVTLGLELRGYIRLWTLFQVKGCLYYLMRSFYVTGEVPKAHPASGLKYLWPMNEMCHHSLLLVSTCKGLSHTITHPHILTLMHPIQWDNPTVMLNFYSHLQQGSVFFFSCFRIISVPVASWSFQFPLFQFRLPEASGNNETVGHGKIISLPSIHIVVLLTHDPGLSPPSVYLAFDV